MLMHAATHACRILSNCQVQPHGVEHIDDYQQLLNMCLECCNLCRASSVLCLARAPDSCGITIDTQQCQATRITRVQFRLC